MNNLPEKIQNLVTIALDRIRAKDIRWFEVVKNIPITINNRMRRGLGRAWMNRNQMELNRMELSGPYVATATDEGLLDTITHEYAHFIAFFLYKDRGHGRWWKACHRSLGGQAKACVNAKKEGYTSVRNVIKRIVMLRPNGQECKTTLVSWNRHKEYFLRNGYTYLRTIEIDPNINSVKTIHEANLTLVAAQKAS